MKLILTILLLIFGLSAKSQINPNLVSTLDFVEKSTFFKECFDFKKTLESQCIEVYPKIKDEAEKEMLKEAYNSVWLKYDEFLKLMKKDLIGSQSNTGEYSELLLGVKSEYETSILPIYEKHSGGKGISDELLGLGLDLVKKVISNVKNRKFEKKEIMNDVLNVVNQRFYKKIRLKSFAELNLQSASSQNISSTSNNLVENVTTNEAISVPAATFDTFSGQITFFQIKDGQKRPMIFQSNTGKDIVVEDEKTDLNDHSNATLDYLTSLETYQQGTKFKIEANANCFIYVLVLNSGNTVLLHPKVSYKTEGKDIEIIAEASPTVGSLTIPNSGLFSIVANSDGSSTNTEDFALLISKSELIMDDTIGQLNALTGSLDQRLSQLFENQMISNSEANLDNTEGVLKFSYNSREKNIFPLVFKILK